MIHHPVNKLILSFNAQHLFNKLRNAAAICVIKNKPANVNSNYYCLELQSKLKNNEVMFKTTNSTNNCLNTEVDMKDIEDLRDLDLVSTQDSGVCEILSRNDSYEVKKTTKLNLSVIHAIREIKNLIKFENGECILGSQESFSESTKNSGSCPYKSQKYLNEGYRVEKKINKIDHSLDVLMNFLRKTSNEESQIGLYNHVSHILGSAIDILFKQNIHTPSINKCVDIINEMISNVLKTSDEHMKESWKNKLKCFYTFNKSLILIQHALNRLCECLNEFSKKIKTQNDNENVISTEVIELCLVFIFIEELLNKYIIIKKERENTFSQKPTKDETESIKNGILSQNWNLSCNKSNSNFNFEEFEKYLSDTLISVAVECMELYPLISFVAMECANKNFKDGQIVCE